jgi:pimeloyl-ACP methyl ester carboxylesterase
MVVGCACSSSSMHRAASTTSATGPVTTSVAGASGIPPTPPDKLYTPPHPLPQGKPGAIIWAESVAGIDFQPPQKAWRFLYHSRDQNGNDVAVSAFAIVPAAAAAASGRAVYAWAHGTVGLGDQCAPSHKVRDNLPPYAGEVVKGNALVVATDYIGLGTPGAHTYLAGAAEGQAVLDSVRAASTLPNVGPLGDVVLAGHSQGGAAALFAAQLAPSYAPTLHIKGVLAIAPGAELRLLTTSLTTSPYKGVLLVAAIGLHAAFPTVVASDALTPSAVADLPRVAGECIDATVARYKNLPATSVVKRDPSQVPQIARILDQNSPGGIDPHVPIMIVQGERDEQVPVTVSAALAAKYCTRGATVSRRIYAGATHEGVLDAAHDDLVAWLSARYEHKSATTTC